MSPLLTPKACLLAWRLRGLRSPPGETVQLCSANDFQTNFFYTLKEENNSTTNSEGKEEGQTAHVIFPLHFGFFT